MDPFDNFFSFVLSQITIRLVDTPRNVISSANFFGVDEIVLDGPQLLNYLFKLKNSDASSKERARYIELKHSFELITQGAKFDLTLNNDKINLVFSEQEDLWISADFCGLGLFQILVILSNIILTNEIIFLIEEPENNMHPSLQRNLLQFLKNSNHHTHYIIATHSNVFLDINYVDRVYQTFNPSSIIVSDQTSKATILHDLGYSVSDNLIADLIILTEGPSDKPIIIELLKKLKVFQEFQIKVWALGGDIMSSQDLSVFTETYKVYAIIDNDPSSLNTRKKFIQNCEKYSISLLKLEKYSIENYFSLRALRKIFPKVIPNSIKIIEPNKKLEKQIGLNCKKKNREIIEEMNLEELSQTDLLEFIENIVETLKK